MLEPCEPWAVIWTCDVDCLSASVTGTAVEVATEILWAMSGRRFGYCTTTLRPCRVNCTDVPGYGGTYPAPLLHGGRWYNITCPACGDSCSCKELSEVILPEQVASIVEIKIDGAPLVTGAYRVDNGIRLVRTDGNKWPSCNDLTKADTEDDTWSVTATFGNPVPSGGSLAAGELACELSKALASDKECRLPRGVTQVSRQGVTINYSKVTESLAEGNTGLYLVDLFLRTFNPGGLVAPARVYNIDAPIQRVQTWP